MSVTVQERQLAEREMLLEMYPSEIQDGPGGGGAAAALAAAAEAGIAFEADEWPELSFQLQLAVAGTRLRLNFRLPRGYLDEAGPAEPDLEVSAAGCSVEGRAQLVSAARSALRGDEECIALVAEAAVDAARDLATAAPPELPLAAPEVEAASEGAPLKRALLWMHHLKSPKKRKLIVEWAAELGLGGVSKPGFPGILVVEGSAADVDEYIRRLKRLRWQAIAVKGEGVAEKRGLPPKVLEVAETGMSEVARLCDVAGCAELFRTQLH